MRREPQMETAATTMLAQRSQPVVPGISDVKLDVIMIGMLRSVTFFDEAKRFVHVSHFIPGTEAHYILLYNLLCRLRMQYSRFHHTLLEAEVLVANHQDPQVMSDAQWWRLLDRGPGGLLYCAYTLPVDNVDLEQCQRYLREFLYERGVANPLRAVMATATQHAYPANLSQFLDSVQAARLQVENVGRSPIVETMPDPDTMTEPAMVFRPTGCSFVDQPFGGQRVGDANGILGVIGSGKSTMAAHMGVCMARSEVAAAAAEGRQIRPTVILTYEESAKKMLPRVWSAAAQIDRKKLEKMVNARRELTSAAQNNLADYEQSLAGQGSEREGEYERWVKARSWLNESLFVMDMSGSEISPGAGGGYVPEMVTALEQLNVHRGGVGFQAVLIDHAGPVCERYMHAKNMEQSQLRTLLKQVGEDTRRCIAERFQCTVWLMHQIAAANGTKQSTAKLHHTMAAESRAFAEYLALCGCIGVPDPQSGCRLLHWSKTRYARVDEVTPVTLRINDMFAQMDDVTELYRADTTANAFVSPSEYGAVHGDTGVGPRGRGSSRVAVADAATINLSR